MFVSMLGIYIHILYMYIYNIHIYIYIHIIYEYIYIYIYIYIHTYTHTYIHTYINVGNVKDAATLMILEVLDTLLVVEAEHGVSLIESSGVLYTLIGMLLNPAEPVLVYAV